MQSLPELKCSTLQEKLLKIFGDQANIQQCIEHIMTDRVFYTKNETYHFAKDLVATYSNSYGRKIELADASLEDLELFAKSDPIAFLILTIIYEHDKKNVDTTTLREIAFESFQVYYMDKNFGRHFFYSRSLLPVLTYLLITSGFWKPSGNDTVEETTNEQVMGVYKGTVSFSKGQIIPQNIRDAISTACPKHVDQNGAATEWFATPLLDDGIENRLDRFYIPSRRKVQKEIVRQYEEALAKTSDSIEPIFKGIDRNVLMVIGPYGCGKSTYLKKTYDLEETKANLVSLSVDTLKGFFASATSLKSTGADHHFESAILKDTVKSSNIEYLFATGAFVDRYRFNSITRAYTGKKVQLIEIANPSIQDTVLQYCDREHTDNYQFALPTANDAQKFRPERIKSLETDPKMINIDYKLVCNVPGKGFVDVLEITAKNGKREIKILDEGLRTALTNAYNVSEEQIKSLLQEKKTSLSAKV